MQERFNEQFVDEDTGLLNIGKYDHDMVIEFIEEERNIRDEEIVNKVNKLPTKCIECNKVGINPYGECQCSYGGEKRYITKKDVINLIKSTNKTS